MSSKHFLIFIVCLCLNACNSSQQGKSDETTEVTTPSTTVSLSDQAIKRSAPITKAIIDEKNLLLSAAANSANAADVETISSLVANQTAAKAEELLIQSKAIIDCAVISNLDECSK